MSSPNADAVLAWLSANEPDGLSRLIDWLRIPSISTQPAHAADCRRAAEWAAHRLREAGLEARLVETGSPAAPGHPIVMASTPGPDAPGLPRVLFYGHYDVQPIDPEHEWTSKPFEPVIVDAAPGAGGPGRRVVARGAVDDKGQVQTFLEALRAWKHVSGQPAGGVPFTVILEGEEESGSVNLEAFLSAHAPELRRCSFCLISDTGMLARGRPAITCGVRGLAYTQITLHGPNQDLHSGLWGGRVSNPNAELAKILARLWDDRGRVAIPGFYDAVRPLDECDRAAWRTLGLNAEASLAGIGLPPQADRGEQGFSALEREWARPTAEINGLWGGYTGVGAKTVIPAHASAKVSFRLVADQQPAAITRLFFDWLATQTPPGFRWTLEDLHGGPGVTVNTDTPAMQAARRAVQRAAGVEPALIRSGGSIPVAGQLKTLLGLDTIFLGFGLEDDRVHSPNEKFEIDCFRLGCRCHALLIDELRSARAR